MAINFNPPPPDHESDAAVAMHGRGLAIKALLSGLHGSPAPAPHQNELVDNAFGFKTHHFTPHDLATG